MYNIGAFLIGVFLLVFGRLAWKQTPEQYQANNKHSHEPVAPHWTLKPVAIVVTLLGAFLIFASIIITIK